MRKISVKNKNLDLSEFKKRSALESDYEELIKDSCVVTDENGEIIALYYNMRDIDGMDAFEKSLKTIQYTEGVRRGGLKTRSAIFGYAPKMAPRKDFCSSTVMSREFPKEHSIICEFGKKISEIYEKELPDMFGFHNGIADEKLDDTWRIEGTPFTSGIVNKNNALKYHYDVGNFEDVYSNMIAFKKNIKGGHLAMPEYGIAFEISNHSLCMFDGQSILHGVTPIEKTANDAHRYTVVYYSLKEMWNCMPIEGELAQIREKRARQELESHNKRKKGATQ